MWEYPSICLYEFCFLLILMSSALWSERHWTNLFSYKIFDETSVSLLSLAFHPTFSYSSLMWPECGIWFFRALCSWNVRDRDTAREPPLGHPVGQKPALARVHGSKLPSWWGLEKKSPGLWLAMLPRLWEMMFKISLWPGVKWGKKFQ